MTRVLEPTLQEILACGSGKVEVFGERGRKEEEVPFENYITPAGLAFQRWMNRRAFSSPLIGGGLVESSTLSWTFAGAHDNTNAPATDPVPVFPFTGLVLTNDTSAENTASSRLAGKMVGYALRKSYSGADVYRGAPNPLECVYTGSLVKLVFDWPTSGAIGTFQTVAWHNFRSDGATGTGRYQLGMEFVTRGSAVSVNHNDRVGGYYDAASGNLYAFTSTTENPTQARYLAMPDPDASPVLNWDTASVLQFPATNLARIMGMAKVGSEWFVTDYADRDVLVYDYQASGTIASLKRTLAAPDAIAAASTTLAKGIAADGTYIYTIAFSAAVLRVYKRNPSDGSVVASVDIATASDETAYSMTYDTAHGVVLIGLSGSPGGAAYSAILAIDPGTMTEAGRWHGPVPPAGNMNGMTQMVHKDGRSFMLNDYLQEVNLATMGARARLASPVAKSALQTMKITYQFAFA